MHKRRLEACAFNGIALENASFILEGLISLPLNLAEAERLLSRSLTIALTHSLAVYDSVYIALAQQYTCPLVTLDRRQQTAAENAGVVVRTF